MTNTYKCSLKHKKHSLRSIAKLTRKEENSQTFEMKTALKTRQICSANVIAGLGGE